MPGAEAAPLPVLCSAYTFSLPFLVIFTWAVTGKGFPSLMM
jgi:hypothetical protein